MTDISHTWPPDYSQLPPKMVTQYYLLDDAGLNELNYLRAVHQNLIDYLAEDYRSEKSVAGSLCDYRLDRSGRLLGEVREAARKAVRAVSSVYSQDGS